MSVPTFVQASGVPVAISTDDITYDQVVCKKAFNFNGSTPTNVEDTDCGPAVGLGSNSWTVDMELALNKTPNSGEISAEGLLAIWQAQTFSYIKLMYPSPGGTDLYIQGGGYITSLVVQGTTGNIVTATLTFTGQGSPDITP